MAQATIDTTVTGLQGVPVAANTPAVNQALVFNGTSWVPTTQNFLPLSGGTITGQLSVAASGSINSAGPITGSALNVTGQSTLTGPEIINLTGAGLPVSPLGTPPLRLAAQAGNATNASVVIDQWSSSPFVFRSANGTPTAPGAITNGMYLGGLAWLGYNGTAYQTLGGTPGSYPSGIGLFAAENWTATANGSHIVFNAVAPGTTVGVQALNINGNAVYTGVPLVAISNISNVPSLTIQPGVGSATDLQMSLQTPTQEWRIGNAISNGNFYIYNQTTPGFAMSFQPNLAAVFNGPITSSGFTTRAGSNGATTGNQFNIQWISPAYLWIDNVNQGVIQVSSDYRTKKGVKALSSMWTKVKALKPVSYTQAEYTPAVATKHHRDPDDEKSELIPMFPADDIERWGFVAHELQETLVPSAASGVKDQPDLIQSPNPLTLLACITKALQEAMARIEVLEGKLSLA